MELDIVVTVGVFATWVTVSVVLIFGRREWRGESVRSRRPWGMLGLVLQAAGMAIAWGWKREDATPFVAAANPVAWAMAAATIGVAWASAAFAVAAIRTLGKQWSLLPRLVEGHDLIEEGPYSIVRHPIYTAFLGLLIATGVTFSTIEGTLAAIALYLVGTWIRVRFEERLLREVFGERFDEYSRRVPPLLPFTRLRRFSVPS